MFIEIPHRFLVGYIAKVKIINLNKLKIENCMKKMTIAEIVLGMLGSLGYFTLYMFNPHNVAVDVTHLTPVNVYAIKRPKTVEKLQKLVRESDRPVAIAGARYSQGGQIAYPDALVIDMTRLNNVISFDEKQQRITVQAGMTWAQLQKYIDAHNLSLRVMQSYNDFTVGGGLSVNVHARDLAYGPIINTVESIKIILADGSLVSADRTHNSDLFKAAIGGYGLVGIICEASLLLTENIPLERRIQLLSIDEYPTLFKTIYADERAVLHNADLFPNKFKETLSTTWYTTDKELTITERLQSTEKSYLGKRALEFLIRRIPALKKKRSLAEVKKIIQPEVVWRNYEMSYSIKQLAMSIHFPTAMTLQEYFVPTDKLIQATELVRTIINKYDVNVLNLSIRHVPQDTMSILAYARQESFALVLYLNLLNTQEGKEYACNWTRELIDGMLALGGTYYLPYLMCATKEQFYTAYPRFNEFMQIKKQYDPTSKFKNMLWKMYVEE